MSSHLEAIVLSRLTYVSRARPDLTSADLQDVLRQAQVNNVRSGISGILCFNKNYFLQSIEGSRGELNQLLNKLVIDARHYDVQVIEHKEITQRTWQEWSMNYVTPSSKNKSIYLKNSSAAGFNPYLLTCESAYNLLVELTQAKSE